MGSPLGPVLANIFMCAFEEKWFMNAKISPSFWNQHADDTFTMFHLSLSSAEAPYLWEIFEYCWVWEGVRGTMGNPNRLFSLSLSRHSPRAAIFPLPRLTAKKPLRSKQHET